MQAQQLTSNQPINLLTIDELPQLNQPIASTSTIIQVELEDQEEQKDITQTPNPEPPKPLEPQADGLLAQGEWEQADPNILFRDVAEQCRKAVADQRIFAKQYKAVTTGTRPEEV